MKFKRALKAFSLAEILIVMTVIGVIATLTMPQLIGGVDEAHYKAGYKKAYTTVANVAGILKADDELPVGTTDAQYQDAVLNVFRGLCDNIEVEGLVKIDATNGGIDSGGKVANTDVKPGGTYGGITCGEGSGLGTVSYTKGTSSPWIIAADGMAFTVNKGGGCGTKAAINAPGTTAANAVANACVLIVVDVNGLQRLPNKIEDQVKSDLGTKMKKLTGDRYYIFITQNGIAKGSEDKTVSGRLISGQK